MPAYLGVGRLQRCDRLRYHWPRAHRTAPTCRPRPTCRCPASMNTAAFNLPISLTTVWAAACLAALQGGQARRVARSSMPKHQNRVLTARKQRFLAAVHSVDMASARYRYPFSVPPAPGEMTAIPWQVGTAEA